LSGAGNDKKKKDALAKFGMKPGDADMIGESFLDVMGRIDSGGKGLKPEERNLALQDIFSVESRAAMMTLLSEKGRAQVKKNRALMSDEAGFAADAAINSTGDAAEMRQNETGEMLVDYENGAGRVGIRIDKARRENKENKDSAVSWVLKEKISEAAAGFGAIGEQATNIGNSLGTGLLGGYMGGPMPININITLRDEDGRSIPHEHQGKAIERQNQ
jgi:hypothetical protein